MIVTPRTRAHSVAELLRERIQNGAIAPGTHLMEVPLAKEMGVSRTPVHDALTRLAEEGLVVYNPNRGFLVRRFEAKDVFDSMTLRATLEALGCRLIGERGLDDQSQQYLTAMLDEQHKALNGEEWNNERAVLWQDLNLHFHYALLELADNPWLTDAVHRARKMPPIFDSKSRVHDLTSLWLMYRRDQSRQALAEHRQVVDALSRREVARAEGMMREHILVNRDVLMRRLTSPAEAPERHASETELASIAATSN